MVFDSVVKRISVNLLKRTRDGIDICQYFV